MTNKWDRTYGTVAYVMDRVQSRIEEGWYANEAFRETLALVDPDLYARVLKDGVRWTEDIDSYLINYYGNAKNWK
jgi:hypothetical protein